jgi:hypothetical protein
MFLVSKGTDAEVDVGTAVDLGEFVVASAEADPNPPD